MWREITQLYGFPVSKLPELMLYVITQTTLIITLLFNQTVSTEQPCQLHKKTSGIIFDEVSFPNDMTSKIDKAYQQYKNVVKHGITMTVSFYICQGAWQCLLYFQGWLHLFGFRYIFPHMLSSKIKESRPNVAKHVSY